MYVELWGHNIGLKFNKNLSIQPFLLKNIYKAFCFLENNKHVKISQVNNLELA
jgi:hypothetical protein